MFLRASFVTTVTAIVFLSAQECPKVPAQDCPRVRFFPGIMDGFYSEPLFLPHHVLIGCAFENGSITTIDWLCNGAIINDRFVATSAICTLHCNNFRILVGSNVHPVMNVPESATIYSTEPGRKPDYAPGYVQGGRAHDLALLKANEPIIFSEFVKAVKLPPFRGDFTFDRNVSALASGFGQLHKHNPLWELQFLTYTTINDTECFKSFPDRMPNKSYDPFCARSIEYNRVNRGSLCEEFGAPIVHTIDNRTLMGFYQYSRETCDDGGPEVSLNIGWYIDWIRQTAGIEFVPKPNPTKTL